MITAQNRAFRVSEIFVIVDHFLKEIEDFDEFLAASRVDSIFYMASRDEDMSRIAILLCTSRSIVLSKLTLFWG